MFIENIKLKNPELLSEYYQKKYFLFTDENGALSIAAMIDADEQIIEQFIDHNIIYLSNYKFEEKLLALSAEFNTHNAINSLKNQQGIYSAKQIDYHKMVVGFLLMCLSSFIFSKNLFNIVNNILFVLQNLLKSVMVYAGITTLEKKKPVFDRISKQDLPIYSILIPLYQEEIKAKSILEAIDKLNYPKEKLDVKLIIEADDQTTNRALMILNMPQYVQIIKVPYSLPRTKPKALNYAMPFVKGKYLTIYDAEDEPEPDQLLKSVMAFEQLPSEYVCLQARLNYYNANQTVLTKLFSVEYSVWFEYLLKGMSASQLPMPLGGTSNHFKVEYLHKVGLWDAYNVTEDADLGLRLYVKGYKVDMIDSVTMEEAPVKIYDWLMQRSRWIKGYIQTIAVFMKNDIDHKKITLAQMVSVYIILGLPIYGFLFFPWLLIILCTKLHYMVHYLWLFNSFFAFSYMYLMAYIVMSRSNSYVKLSNWRNYFILLISPFYFILHCAAAYIAVWEVITAPFRWNKTPHGHDENMFNSV